MTQEQKPESAEFRTLESGFRTRQEQAMALASDTTSPCPYPFKSEVIERHLIEAEARGAAEQRRKDAEGVEPFAWVSPEDVDPRNTWCNGNGYGFRILEHHSIQTPTATIPLYTRPANVTALEARVKELEGEVKEEQRIANLRADAIDSLTNLCAAMEQEKHEAVAAERERCAKMLDASSIRADEHGAHWGERYAKCWAAAIREGGEHG